MGPATERQRNACKTQWFKTTHLNTHIPISSRPTLPQQEAVINELKTKTNSVREKKLLQQDEVYNGALEDILLGLKNEPYRRADAVRRSQRRRIDSNRLSRTMEEMEF
ncbi:formin-like protein [Aedes albopictus]|uniref:DAD domain-containing protein n=1 Tax=Aedes albopictus TaxID=7160 RepID=A0ABM1Y1P5_AEDAL